jgi:N-acetylglucosaminyl-diphospho-decaprenol L-rhamnosyltransferase
VSQPIYLITVNYDSADWIAQLIESIRSDSSTDYTLIIINNSAQDSVIHSFMAEDVLLLEVGRNVGFGAACNLGLEWVYQQFKTAIVWLINPDAQLLTGSLKAASQVFTHYPEAAIVGTIVQEPNGKLWFGGGRFNSKTGAIFVDNLFADSGSDYLACDWVTGCSLLLNLAQFPACPQFDPAYFLYYEDFDFCRRYAKLGHSVGITRKIQVIHSPSSIADRNPAFKLKCSTVSYLLTLERHTSRFILLLRLLRLALYSLVLLPIKPQRALGKGAGLAIYLNHKILHSRIRFE